MRLWGDRIILALTSLGLGIVGFTVAWIAWHLWADHVLLHSVVQFLNAARPK